MSIIDTFDNESEEFIKPGSMSHPVEGFPKTVIVTFSPKFIELAKSLCKTEEISSMSAGIRLPIYQFIYKEINLGIYMTLIGGAATTGLMEEAIAKGAKKILIFGSCGVLDKQLTEGRLILPTSAYRDEGTSYHYMPVSDFVEIPTSKRLGDIFTELGIPFIFGKTWTTDAFYRETKNNVAARKKAGCISVEMECASVMAAGQFRNVPVYQFFFAQDNLDGEVWDARTLGKLPSTEEEKYLKIALEAAIRIEKMATNNERTKGVSYESGKNKL